MQMWHICQSYSQVLLQGEMNGNELLQDKIKSMALVDVWIPCTRTSQER